MLPSPSSRRPSARRALDQTALQQIRLVDVFDRVSLLADRDRQSREADGAPVELLDDRSKDLPIKTIEPRFHEREGVQVRCHLYADGD